MKLKTLFNFKDLLVCSNFDLILKERFSLLDCLFSTIIIKKLKNYNFYHNNTF